MPVGRIERPTLPLRVARSTTELNGLFYLWVLRNTQFSCGSMCWQLHNVSLTIEYNTKNLDRIITVHTNRSDKRYALIM